MTDLNQRIADAEAAKLAWERYVAPALEAIRADYMVKLTENAERPMEGRALQAVQNMSLALRVTREVEAQIKAIMTDGDAARAELGRARRIADLSPEGRRFADYAPA